MKALKYILNIIAFSVIYIFMMFVAPTITQSTIRVCTALGVTVALEYAYVWFVPKGRFFAVPLSFLPIIMFGAFYFNHPSSPDIGLGMWVLARYLVLPYAATSCAVSAVMYFVKRHINAKSGR